MQNHQEAEQIPVGAVLERVEFKKRQIIMGFDHGDRRLETNSALYRLGRRYPRSQQAFASQLVAQIGKRVIDVATNDAQARLRVTFDNQAVLWLGEIKQRTARPSARAARAHRALTNEKGDPEA